MDRESIVQFVNDLGPKETERGFKKRLENGEIDKKTFNQYLEVIEEVYVTNNHYHKIWQSERDKFWRTYVYDAEKPKNRRLIKRKEKADLIHFLYRFLTDEMMTLESFLELWLKNKTAISASSEYPKRIRSDWNRFYKGTSLVEIPLSDLTPDVLEKWVIQTIKDKTLTKRAYNNMAIFLRQGLDYAVKLGLIPKNPYSQVVVSPTLFRRPQKKNNCMEVFTKEEVRMFEKVAWEDFNNPGKKVYRLAPLAALFIFISGLRVGELTGLRFEDIDGYIIHIRRMVRKDDHSIVEHTKSAAGERDLPLIDKMREIIGACRNVSPGGWVFSEHERPLPSRIVEELYRKYCKILETYPKSPRCARKTVASVLVDSMNIRTASKFLGHKDAQTTFNSYVRDQSKPCEIFDRLQKTLHYEEGMPDNPNPYSE